MGKVDISKFEKAGSAPAKTAAPQPSMGKVDTSKFAGGASGAPPKTGAQQQAATAGAQQRPAQRGDDPFGDHHAVADQGSDVAGSASHRADGAGARLDEATLSQPARLDPAEPRRPDANIDPALTAGYKGLMKIIAKMGKDIAALIN
jgi:hypothetical protein